MNENYENPQDVYDDAMMRLANFWLLIEAGKTIQQAAAYASLSGEELQTLRGDPAFLEFVEHHRAKGEEARKPKSIEIQERPSDRWG
jgi:hypothetical protein